MVYILFAISPRRYSNSDRPLRTVFEETVNTDTLKSKPLGWDDQITITSWLSLPLYRLHHLSYRSFSHFLVYQFWAYLPAKLTNLLVYSIYQKYLHLVQTHSKIIPTQEVPTPTMWSFAHWGTETKTGFKHFS